MAMTLTAEQCVSRSKRVSTWVPKHAWQEFMDLADRDGITMSDRIQALVQLWSTDQGIRAKADKLARELAAEKRRQRRERGSGSTPP